MNIKKLVAFIGARESTEAFSPKLYTGLAPVKILGVNPNADEIQKIYNSEEKRDEPVYLDTREVELPNGEKETIKRVRIDIFVGTNEEEVGVRLITRVSFFIQRMYRYTRDGSKINVINAYGETAWIPVTDVEKGQVPDNMNWYNTKDMRPSYYGEEQLTKFLKAYLNIPTLSYMDRNGVRKTIEEPANAEARLSKIEDYFNGDVSEIKSVIKLMPDNKVKVLIGVNTTDRGQYQNVFTNEFLKNSQKMSDWFKKQVTDAKANGMYEGTDFTYGDLEEYSSKPTNFNDINVQPSEASDLPFGPGSSDPFGMIK